ncbi:MAG: hypothetical protein KJ056_12355 [Acidimicrobiia bacterium]|nr:hypothetical protein [Acidimicrobiia bacterium]
MVLSLVLVLAAGMLAGCMSTGGEVAPAQRLLMSRSHDRTNPVGLSGAAVKGSVFVFLSSADSIKRTEWFLDNPAATGTPRQVERQAPFDFAGTRHHGEARAFSTRELRDGYHEITARLTLAGGATKKVSSRFRVANGSASGTPTPTTSPTTVPPAAAPPPTTPTTAPAPQVPAAPSGGSPTAASTGWRPTGVSLAPYSGPCLITVAGTVIDGKDLACSTLEVRADNVRISRSRIRASGDFAILFRSGTGLVVSESEVTSTSPGAADRAIALWGADATVQDSYVHGTRRGIELGNGARILGNYVDDFVNNSDAHATAILSSGGTRNVVISGNTLGCGTNHCSSAISLYPQNFAGGPNDDIVIDGNLLNGGGFCTYLGYTPAEGERPNTNIRVTDNVFGNKYYPRCGQYGPVASWTPPPTGTGNVWSGNTDASGGPVVASDV